MPFRVKLEWNPCPMLWQRRLPHLHRHMRVLQRVLRGQLRSLRAQLPQDTQPVRGFVCAVMLARARIMFQFSLSFHRVFPGRCSLCSCAPCVPVVSRSCVFLPGALSSCSDGVQNGNEDGVDCGGICPTSCVANDACTCPECVFLVAPVRSACDATTSLVGWVQSRQRWVSR